ncbi:transcriptional regulator [Streptomyces sp. URMC 125]|uniref:transcriptional regulator n=1 Tax=Streptomyces sp. URMC 125 TaxID=3423419 RepID=UPI003F1BC2CB
MASPTPRARFLADRLSAMLPGSTAVRASLQGPHTPWPHLDLRAAGATGAPVHVTRTQAITAARWIIRTHPDAGWQHPRTFDLRTGTLDGGVA